MTGQPHLLPAGLDQTVVHWFSKLQKATRKSLYNRIWPTTLDQVNDFDACLEVLCSKGIIRPEVQRTASGGFLVYYSLNPAPGASNDLEVSE